MKNTLKWLLAPLTATADIARDPDTLASLSLLYVANLGLLLPLLWLLLEHSPKVTEKPQVLKSWGEN